MIFTLGGLQVWLDSQSPEINAYWRHLLGDFITEKVDQIPDVRLSLQLTDTLPPTPPTPPFFTDAGDDPEIGGVLEAYHLPQDRTLLNFFDGGHVTIPSQKELSETACPIIHGLATSSTIPNGRLEDITTVGLAPFLRRKNRYLLHASGASIDGKAAIFVGKSFSGKSTTVLNLVFNGWKLLANDIIVLEQSKPILAHPFSDYVRVRPKTIGLLPQLADYEIGVPFLDHIETPADILPTHELVAGDWSPPAEIKAIFFPQIEDREDTVVEKQPSTIALAHMLEESLDQWDQASLMGHTMILAQLSQQADCYVVKLGRDLPQVPPLLKSLLD